MRCDHVRNLPLDRVGRVWEAGSGFVRPYLSRAAGWYLEHKVLVYTNETVVFDLHAKQIKRSMSQD